MHLLNYPFDENRIATTPLRQRDQARLLIYDRPTGQIGHQHFSSFLDYLHTNDLVVINNTRVFPARLHAWKSHSPNAPSCEPDTNPQETVTTPRARDTARKIELLLIRPDPQKGGLCWEALVKGRLRVPSTLILPEGGKAHLIEDLGAGRKKILFDLSGKEDIYTYLDRWGEVPLPPYIVRRRKAEETTPVIPTSDPQEDQTAYQTVYSQHVGSIAAPTAGLHFTESLLKAITDKGVQIATVTLHIGPDTFRPVQTDSVDQHKMSGERFEIPDETVYAFAKTKRTQGRVFAVGTSVVRSLESAIKDRTMISALRGETDLFITPGYTFRAVDALITNFHPPMSTGIFLVGAFAGCQTVLNLYQEAMNQGYRFLTYGDAMLIL